MLIGGTKDREGKVPVKTSFIFDSTVIPNIGDKQQLTKIKDMNEKRVFPGAAVSQGGKFIFVAGGKISLLTSRIPKRRHMRSL